MGMKGELKETRAGGVASNSIDEGRKRWTIEGRNGKKDRKRWRHLVGETHVGQMRRRGERG